MHLVVLASVLGAFLLVTAIVRAVLLVRQPNQKHPSANRERRALPVLLAHHGLGRRVCGDCYHFQKTGIEEVRRRAPAAAEAARWLSPTMMAASEQKGWDASAGYAEDGQPGAPLQGGPDWSEIGICHARPGVLTFVPNTCENWK